MKILIAYYSRTETTKKVAENIAQKLGADLEEIRDTVQRLGAVGYLKSGRDSMKKRLTKLEPASFDPADYDLVILGTPIWGWNMCTPIRTYIAEQKEKMKSVAFFCTMGGSGDKKAFAEMEQIIGKSPRATLALTTKDVVAGNIEPEISAFVDQINTDSALPSEGVQAET